MRQFKSQHVPRPTIEMLEARQLMSVVLTGTFAGHLPKTLPVAGTTQIAVHLKNTGTATAVEAVTVQVFASPTPTPSSSDILLASTQQNIRLRPRASVNSKLSAPSPTTLPTGNYYLLAEVNGAVVTAAPVNIQAPFSDLAVSFAALPSKPVEIDGYSAGQRVATVNITNDGNVAINGKANLSLYLSANNVLDTNASLIQTISNMKVSLKPGKSKAVQFHIAVPPGTAIGGYFLLARANGVGSLARTTTTNSITVSSRRIAVVNQLPRPIKINNNTYVNIYGDAGDGGGYDIGGDDGGYIYDSDPVAYDNSGDSSDGGSSNTDDSGPASGGSASANSSSGGSSGDDSSDNGDTSDFSSGGDF